MHGILLLVELLRLSAVTSSTYGVSHETRTLNSTIFTFHFKIRHPPSCEQITVHASNKSHAIPLGGSEQ